MIDEEKWERVKGIGKVIFIIALSYGSIAVYKAGIVLPERMMTLIVLFLWIETLASMMFDSWGCKHDE